MTYKRWSGPTRPVSNGATVVHLDLEANADAPGRARAAVARLHAGADEADQDMLERALLLTSELVTNSVTHAACAEVRVDIWPADGWISVVVTDDGPGFAAIAQPTTIAESDGGFGLPLVDTLSEVWGSGCDGEAWVWFEVGPRPIEVPPAGPRETHESSPADLLDIRMVIDSVKNHALVALDPDGHVTNWGTGALALTGYSAEEQLGRVLSDLYAEVSAEAFARERATAASEGSHQTERWLRRKDGSRLWAEIALSPILDRSGNLRGLSALISDVTERSRVIAELRSQAMSDELTGLPNRRRWSEELDREMARSRRLGTPLAIAMLDLNEFKAFNDTNGHPAGDELLRDVARGWSEAVRATDMLARFGGDEFSITLPDCSPELALAVVARVQAASPPRIASSAGIASSDGTESAEELLARADAALYDAKRHARPVSVAVTDS